MEITVLSVREVDGELVARAAAVTADAHIRLEVRFAPQGSEGRAELWDRARAEVLRYLDIA